ncbi:hypothetical protein HJC23_000236 [Cyclotella cryptica]|uniref:Sulfotransferase domain-containing protein n=1 Tax=Cyclotella cryptica TaxID=29204 RepID=A0ABD3PLY3_9STRA|eukprot:CCRYP_013413-RA/>CCRYP_013413-RA protein AED:0.10 eAED:0.10 QI:103/1/1/1/0.66/0.5/4/520/600
MNQSTKQVVVCTIVLIVLFGTYYNSRQITRLKPLLSDHDLPSTSGRAKSRNGRKNGGISNSKEFMRRHRASCLKARKNTVPPSLFGKLPRPFINLGFPKMGTSSLHAFFECGGYKSHHFACGKDAITKRKISCAKCISNSISASKPPLALCEEADMYAQMDNGTFFPQTELLHQLHEGYPQATFFLTFRNMTKWYHSLSHWPPRPRGPHMDERLQKLDITGFPKGKGKNEEEFTEWYCNHVLRVRELIENSDHHLIEVDIEDESTAQSMGDLFGISQGCWGHANVNLNIHPDANTSEVQVSKRQVKLLKRTQDDEVSSNEDQNSKDEYAYEEYNDLDEGYGAYDGGIKEEQKYDKGIQFSASCFSARNDTVAPSMYHKLPRPFINLGFPKMGTTSLQAFFKCGGYTSYHYTCGNPKRLCSDCIQESVRRGLPPLGRCNEADVYTQLDNGRYFPQIELLEEFFKGYPQATFFLTFRNMENWYQSLSNWPPNRTKHYPLTKRFLGTNITGLPKDLGNDISAFSTWHCNHVKRVRSLISNYPSHSLVEIDIEDPTVGDYLAKVFGIGKSCLGRKNVHAQQLQPDRFLTQNIPQNYMVGSQSFR